MIHIEKTNFKNEDFKALVAQLDADLAKRDGEEHNFYHQFNGIEELKHTIVLYDKKRAVGCGAIKEFRSDTVEIKRMYTIPGSRGKGFATQILNALEDWASALGYSICVLETGKRQPEAIALYKKNGYQIIPNYEPYTQMENSVCFEKRLRK
ncbi:GNAT family N-acetyltransferase [Sungkyunkwania multivorans]|uniref:GNAT family N-acetyltransferase n=1 Tax=Sungkyunkwania multivorans TaxID=1173618 RepID=A0ABW3CW73_9FLAO